MAEAGPGLAGAVQATKWQSATVREANRVSPRIVILRLEVEGRLQHLPGQHYVVRLTADDGYTASRSYSVSSAPGDPLVELCIERLDDGEVSGYLYEVVEPGDRVEVRGPIGGWFVWDATSPALAIGGGTGVVPLVAMARHAAAVGRSDLLRLAVSGRTHADLPYADELSSYGATVALTGDGGRRLTRDDLRPLLPGAQTAFVCGSAGFAEALSHELVNLDYPDSRIRVERFGPS
ncbi:FAD-binding oxidoreductase [Jatrophihabitans sp. DSM 45814]